ncbi:MAG: acyltransferase [Planctomycetota bacterium]
MKRSEPLDGLRGLAVLLVLLAHASNAGHHVIPFVDARGLGRSGVFLFFVLSSFLLTSQVLVRLDAGRPMEWGRFALRRFLRVMPAYALCIGVLVGLGVFTWPVGLEHLALVRAEAHLWTVPVEVYFYLALPLVGLGLARVPGTAWRVALVVGAAVALRLAIPPDFPARAPDYRPDVRPFLPVFLAGCALAAGIPFLERAGAALVAAGGLALAALVAMSPSVWERIVGAPVEHTRFHLWFGTHALLWSAVVAAAWARPEAWLGRAASFAPLRALGRISYSTYLFHAIALAYAETWLAGRVSDRAIGPAFFAAAIAMGGLGYALVERPLLGLVGSRRSETFARS